MTTILAARDELMEALRTGWLANATSAGVELQFDNVKNDPPTAVGTEGRPVSWARLTMRHSLGAQDTLGELGNRRFLTGGTITWQIFTAPGDGHAAGDALAEIALGLIRTVRTPSGVWAFDVVPAEIGISGTWFQFNVFGTFRYEAIA